jgi:hypothetical protein
MFKIYRQLLPAVSLSSATNRLCSGIGTLKKYGHGYCQLFKDSHEGAFSLGEGTEVPRLYLVEAADALRSGDSNTGNLRPAENIATESVDST